jgi:hypothetical protein
LHNSEAISTCMKTKLPNPKCQNYPQFDLTLIASTRGPYKYICPTDSSISMTVDVNFLNECLKLEEIINISNLIVLFVTQLF